MSTLVARKQGFDGYQLAVSAASLTFLDLFELYRKYIIHQYDLLNHRTNWFVAGNAFAFATYGFTIQKKLEVASKVHPWTGDFFGAAHAIDWFLIILCLFGIGFSILGYQLLKAAADPIYDIHALFKSIAANAEFTPPAPEAKTIVGRLPHVVGGTYDNTKGPFYTTMLPVLVLLAWTGILFTTTPIVESVQGGIHALRGW